MIESGSDISGKFQPHQTQFYKVFRIFIFSTNSATIIWKKFQCRVCIFFPKSTENIDVTKL